jgi:large subunit ribosomal protein L7/L12
MVAADAKPSEVTTDGGGPASPKVEAIFQKILYLDMVELHLVTELINEKLGITMSAAARARMAAGGNGGAGGGANAAEKEEVKEEKTIFDLRLEGFDPKTKIKVIKEVRVITGLGLKDAKELVEGAPKVLKKDIKKEEAEELKKKLEALGAVVGIV